MSHFERRQLNNNEDKTAPSQKAGFGAVLIRERKAKGLTHLQVSEKTRIRPSVLKALENEQWELLPQPVFVKGLIRSYAQAVGFDQEEVLSLYKKAVPKESEFSRPFIESDKIKRDFSFAVVFLFLIIAAVYYVWKEYPSSNETKLVGESMNSIAADIGKPEDILKKPIVEILGREVEIVDLTHPFGAGVPLWPYFADIEIKRIHYWERRQDRAQRCNRFC